jgi:hypothetical protein
MKALPALISGYELTLQDRATIKGIMPHAFSPQAIH